MHSLAGLCRGHGRATNEGPTSIAASDLDLGPVLLSMGSMSSRRVPAGVVVLGSGGLRVGLLDGGLAAGKTAWLSVRQRPQSVTHRCRWEHCASARARPGSRRARAS